MTKDVRSASPALTEHLTRWERAGRPDPRGYLDAAADPPTGAAAGRFLRAAEAVLSFGESGETDPVGAAHDTASRANGQRNGAPPVPPAGYVLGEVIGSGGAGTVWAATAPGGMRCAVKFTPRTGPLADDEVTGLEFLRTINHPHVIRVYAFWVRPEAVVIAMERASGSLLDLLADHPGGVPAGRLLDLFAHAAAGLDYMNGRGVRHNDVKPHNIFWVDGGGPVGAGGHERGVIADFGIAQLTDNALTVRRGAFTPAYLPPEVLGGQVHERSDEYALGVSWLHLRLGALPNPPTREDLLAATARLPRRRERRAVRRALEKDPADRWPSCVRLVDELRAAAEPPARSRWRRAWPLALAAALGLAGFLLGRYL